MSRAKQTRNPMRRINSNMIWKIKIIVSFSAIDSNQGNCIFSLKSTWRPILKIEFDKVFFFSFSFFLKGCYWCGEPQLEISWTVGWQPTWKPHPHKMQQVRDGHLSKIGIQIIKKVKFWYFLYKTYYKVFSTREFTYLNIEEWKSEYYHLQSKHYFTSFFLRSKRRKIWVSSIEVWWHRFNGETIWLASADQDFFHIFCTFEERPVKKTTKENMKSYILEQFISGSG